MWSVVLGRHFKSIAKLKILAEVFAKTVKVYTDNIEEADEKAWTVKSIEKLFYDKPQNLVVCIDKKDNDALESLAERYLTQSGVSKLYLFLFEVESTLTLPSNLAAVKIEKFSCSNWSENFSNISLALATSSTRCFHRPAYVITSNTNKADLAYLFTISKSAQKPIDVLYARDVNKELIEMAAEWHLFNVYVYHDMQAVSRALQAYSAALYVKDDPAFNELNSDFYWLLLNNVVVFTDCNIDGYPAQFNKVEDVFKYAASTKSHQVAIDRILLQSKFLTSKMKSVGDVQCM